MQKVLDKYPGERFKKAHRQIYPLAFTTKKASESGQLSLQNSLSLSLLQYSLRFCDDLLMKNLIQW